MMIDRESVKRIVIRGSDRNEVAHVVDTYVSHFATCPNASKHRRN